MSNKELMSSREMPYFILSLIVSLLLYILAAVSIYGIAIILTLLIVILYANIVMLGSIRGNGIRISEKQFPDVYERVVSLSTKMNLKKVPDVFVIQSEGALNAFATRFLGRNMVIIYSEVFELAREKGDAELDFIIAHELSHVKRRHVMKNMFIMPAQFIPFLSQAYSRSCEYTCDREAAYYTENGVAAKQALTILGVGKKLYTDVNEDAYLEQINTESNVAVWLGEVLSNHPILPKRIQAIGKFMQVEGTPTYHSNTTKIALGVGAISGIFFAAYIGVILLLAGGTIAYGSLISDNILGEMLSDDLTPLQYAVEFGEEEEVRELVADGADLEEKDSYGATALQNAIYYDYDSIAVFLLESGADPNTSDDTYNALTNALGYENYHLAKILYDYGADPSIPDPFGDSGFSVMGVETVEEFEAELSKY